MECTVPETAKPGIRPTYRACAAAATGSSSTTRTRISEGLTGHLLAQPGAPDRSLRSCPGLSVQRQPYGEPCPALRCPVQRDGAAVAPYGLLDQGEAQAVTMAGGGLLG